MLGAPAWRTALPRSGTQAAAGENHTFEMAEQTHAPWEACADRDASTLDVP
jgi:hypothetical protein